MIGYQKRKQLYCDTHDGVKTQAYVQYNMNTHHVGITSGFCRSTPLINVFKNRTLYSGTYGGVVTQTRLRYNSNTNHITIGSSFSKSEGNSGRSKTNKECSSYLGITVAERALAKVFSEVYVMPANNRGYDIMCNRNYKIDIKSATKKKTRDAWMFTIKRNRIADYFLCLAFSDRQTLQPLHLWLIPGNEVNHLTSLVISASKLDKWDQYELVGKMSKLEKWCSTMKKQEFEERTRYDLK